MFDIGLGELLVIGLVAVFFLGPERSKKLFAEVGKWLKKIEAEWTAAKKEL